MNFCAKIGYFIWLQNENYQTFGFAGNSNFGAKIQTQNKTWQNVAAQFWRENSKFWNVRVFLHKPLIFDPMCYTIDDLCSIFVKKGREDIKVIEVINSTCVGDKKGLKTFFFFILIGCAYWIGNERLYNSSVNDM